MQDTITTIYCLCDEFLKGLGGRDDPQATVSTAEVMTIALTASAFFGGCHETSRRFLHEHGYLPKTLSKSPFNRRWHAIPEAVWDALFFLVAETFKAMDGTEPYLVGRFPFPSAITFGFVGVGSTATQPFEGIVPANAGISTGFASIFS